MFQDLSILMRMAVLPAKTLGKLINSRNRASLGILPSVKPSNMAGSNDQRVNAGGTAQGQ